MFEYVYDRKLSREKAEYYKSMLIKSFAEEYDSTSNRLWNCMRVEAICREFKDVRNFKYLNNILLYLERQDEIYETIFGNVCKYVEELEPWEYIDAYVFDDTFTWLLAITHEELKCLTIGLE